MPAIPAADLTLLRTYPQSTRLYLIVQQPQVYDGAAWSGYFWSCRINGNPAGTPGDLVASLTVDTGAAGPITLLDGMTVLISGTEYGAWDKGIFRVRGDQVVNAATVTLDIGASSEVVGVVANDDYVVVLDEFRVWTRYPRITEAGGVLSWFKDYDITYAGLGGTAAARRQASMPPVPVMGPHAVKFIAPGAVETVDFNWTDSYATYTGATVNAWSSNGLRGTVSGNWASAVQNPAAQTYDGAAAANNDISGMAGFRVWLELGSDVQDPPVEFRRGVRYVFTLRRPGQRQTNDPVHAEPITDFAVTGLSGSYDQGYWRASIEVFDTQADETLIIPGSLVILFADDEYYGTTEGSIGPLDNAALTAPVSDRDNIVFVGRIADDSIVQDPETGNVTFDAISAAEQAAGRETYPVPIENDDGADEWYKCPDLTVDRAVWHYVCWHSTLPLVCDWYRTGNTYEIAAMDFVTGNLYSTVDSFLWDRLFARLLCDRYERFKCDIDRQMQAAAGGNTLWTLATGDWHDQIDVREVTEEPTSTVDLGGIWWNAGLAIPYLSHAPGEVSAYIGTPNQSTALAIDTQATLNTLAGRLLAYQNNRWPSFQFVTGNWRYADIWPQEYVNVSQVTVRHTFSTDLFIVRELICEYDPAAGALYVTHTCEMETDGVAGATIDIPEEPPAIPPPTRPRYPPRLPGGGDDLGRRILATDVGVFATDEIGDTTPVWYSVNSGLSTADDLNVWDIKRDPFHWWTSGGTERRLWAGTATGIWQMDDWPYGTWTQIVTSANLAAATGQPITDGDVLQMRLGFSIETDGLFAFIWNHDLPPGPGDRCWVHAYNGGILNTTQLYVTNDGIGWPAVNFAQHSGGQIIYAVSNKAPGNLVGSRGELWRTINQGTIWTSLENFGHVHGGGYTSVSIPYVDAANNDQFVLWGRGGLVAGANGRYRISTNGGGTFADINAAVSSYSKLGTGGDPDYIWFLPGRPDGGSCKWSDDRGVTYTTLPLVGAAMNCFSSFVVWQAGVLQNALIGGTPTAGAPGTIRVHYWSQGLGAWQDKTGNLEGFGVTEIRQIDRDSMGSA